MTPANIIIYITTRRYSEEEEAAGCLYDGSVPQPHPRQLNINPGEDTRQHGLSKAEKTPYITFNPLFFFSLGPKSNLAAATPGPGAAAVIPSIRGRGRRERPRGGAGDDIQSPPPPFAGALEQADITRRLTA